MADGPVTGFVKFDARAFLERQVDSQSSRKTLAALATLAGPEAEKRKSETSAPKRVTRQVFKVEVDLPRPHAAKVARVAKVDAFATALANLEVCCPARVPAERWRQAVANEGGQFIGGHGMADDAKLRTAAGMSSLWDGEPIKRVRAMDCTGLVWLLQGNVVIDLAMCARR